MLRNVDVGKWVIGGLSVKKFVGKAFIIARGKRDRLSAISPGSTPSPEHGGCKCTILTGKDMVLINSAQGKRQTTAYIQVLQKLMKLHQEYPKFLMTMQKMAAAWTCFK